MKFCLSGEIYTMVITSLTLRGASAAFKVCLNFENCAQIILEFLFINETYITCMEISIKGVKDNSKSYLLEWKYFISDICFTQRLGVYLQCEKFVSVKGLQNSMLNIETSKAVIHLKDYRSHITIIFLCIRYILFRRG